MGERRERLVACGLEGVHAQIDGRALGERPALLRSGGAEARLELRRKPFGEISDHMRGRAREVRGCEPRNFALRELRGSVALAREQSGDRLDAEVASLSQGAEDFGARTWLAHDPGGRAFPAQRVIDERRYRRAVARPCETVRQAPILHRVRGRPATGVDVRQNFDRGGGAGGGSHREGAFWRMWSRVSHAPQRLPRPVTASSICVGQDAAQAIRRRRRCEIFHNADGPQWARRLITERRRNAKPRLGPCPGRQAVGPRLRPLTARAP